MLRERERVGSSLSLLSMSSRFVQGKATGERGACTFISIGTCFLREDLLTKRLAFPTSSRYYQDWDENVSHSKILFVVTLDVINGWFLAPEARKFPSLKVLEYTYTYHLAQLATILTHQS